MKTTCRHIAREYIMDNGKRRKKKTKSYLRIKLGYQENWLEVRKLDTPHQKK